MAEGRVGSSSAERSAQDARAGRGYTRILFGMVLGVGALDLCLLALGFIEAREFRHWGTALLLAGLGAACWELVVRSTQSGVAKPLAWVAFPVAMLFAIATVPFLVLSAAPNLEGWLFRAEARLDEATQRLRITFPLAVERGGINLRLDSARVDDAYVERTPEALRWVDEKTLEIDVARVMRDSNVAKKVGTVQINTLPETPRFRYVNGDEVPAQSIAVR